MVNSHKRPEKAEKIKENFIRLADDDKLNHAYLFFGDDIGEINDFAGCLAGYFEKKEFRKCDLLGDFLAIGENENGNIGIDEARKIKEFLFKKAFASGRRFVLVKDAGLMTPQAQNSMLKIIEEPPERSLIILAAKGQDAVIGTICSRVHKVHFAASSRKTGQKERAKEGDYTRNIQDIIVDLAKNYAKNSAKIKIALERLPKMKQYNLNNKLQGRYLEEVLKINR